MQLPVRIGIAATLLIGVFALDGVGFFQSIDSTMSNARYAATSRPLSGSTVLVEIDSTSLNHIGVWPWPRSIHAELLDALLDMGAAEVAFDIDFSSASTEAEDAVFAEALAGAGGYAYLGAFQQYYAPAGYSTITTALPRFAEQALPVLVNVELDPWGIVFGTTRALETPQGTIQSLATTLAGIDGTTGGLVHIDFSLDLAQADRISVADILEHTVDPERIVGKQVIVGASAVELRDFFVVPRFGTIPGPLVQLAAVETLKANRSLQTPGIWPALFVALIAAGFVLFNAAGRMSQTLILLAAIGIATEIMALALLQSHAVLISTSAVLMSLLALAAFRVVEELAAEYRARRASQARLEYLAHYDDTTGALSRPGVLKTLSIRPSSGVILCRLLDLDTIRASLGQDISDATLREAASRLAGLSAGPVGRPSDQTLAILVPEAGTRDKLEDVAAKAQEALSGIYNIGQHRIHTRVAAALSQPSTEGANQRLLDEAEIALVKSDESRVAAYSPSMLIEIDKRRHLDIEMRQALANSEMELVYQPQFSLRTGNYAGAEALLRWSHPEMGLISPVDFIPLAEETGYIGEIGHWVIERACAARNGRPWLGRVAINVSGKQFRNGENLAMSVDHALRRHSLTPDQIEIEVTESALMNYAEVAPHLSTLRERGVHVAIDDFGTGFSSLSHLANLPFDKLKIDRSFVHDLSVDSGNYRIVTAIIEMAHALGKTVLAEGVETEEEADLLRKLGCEWVQGYLYGRPVSLASLQAVVTANEAARRHA